MDRDNDKRQAHCLIVANSTSYKPDSANWARVYQAAGISFDLLTVDDRPSCIGCDKALDWSDPRWVTDDNGETGCPACFDDKRQDECWSDDAAFDAWLEAYDKKSLEGVDLDACPSPVIQYGPDCLRAAFKAGFSLNRKTTDTPDPEYTPRVFAGMGRAGS